MSLPTSVDGVCEVGVVEPALGLDADPGVPELLIEVPEAEIEKTSALVREVMEAAAGPARELTVPLVADAGVGATWAEAH